LCRIKNAQDDWKLGAALDIDRVTMEVVFHSQKAVGGNRFFGDISRRHNPSEFLPDKMISTLFWDALYLRLPDEHHHIFGNDQGLVYRRVETSTFAAAEDRMSDFLL